MGSNMDPDMDAPADLTASAASISQALTAPKSRNAGPSEDVLGLALTPEVLGHDIVKLFVGPTRKKFTVHKDLICARSDFFSKAFNNNFLEGQEGEMYLPEDDSQAFTDLIDYIYRSALPDTKMNREYNSQNDLGELTFQDRRDHWMRYNLLYSLAEKYCIWDLTNRIMSAIHEPFGDGLLKDVMALMDFAETLTRSTAKSSKLRIYCTILIAKTLYVFTPKPAESDANAHCREALKWFEKFRELFSEDSDLFADALSMQIEQPEDSSIYDWLTEILGSVNVCDFHVHPDGKRCKSSISMTASRVSDSESGSGSENV